MHNVDGSLAPIIKLLREEGLLEEREAELDRVYEAARLLREAERRGRAVVFRVRNYPWPVAGNLVPGRPLLYKLLGAHSDREAYERIMAGGGARLLSGSFRDYFEEVGGGLDVLPALRFYENDGGMYVTSSIFVACRNGVCNASIHRIMVSDDYRYAAVRVVPRHLHALLEGAGDEGLPVAVVIGVDPRLLLSAASSPPFGVFEFEQASLLMGGLRLCNTPRHGLPVPCGASMVVEAVLGPDRAEEGPFTDLLQLYDAVRMEPVLHLERIYVNRVYDPVMHVILPGGTEHMLLMGFPREAKIYHAVASSVPFVRKVRLTPGGGMWLHAVVSIRKQHDGDGKTAGFAALAAHPSLKHVVVVDDDIDPDDMTQVEWAIATRLQAERGLVVIPHARGSTLDPSAEDGLTAKLVVDATAPLRERARYLRPRIPEEQSQPRSR